MTGSPEHVDVIVVGAGLSGVGAAWRLQQQRPGTSYVVLEAREALGGTWDLFRYPGVRSDSDMFTLSYPFKPWRGKQSIASGESIRDYIRETAAEAGIDRHIRLRTRVRTAEWSSEEARWTVRADVTGADGAVTEQTFTADFLYGCTGYYRYDHGHQPEFPGLADYTGRLVHPQDWPRDLDPTGKRVVVIGSGATAITLVPALAGTVERVTMLQRSPSYVAALPEVDAFADRARRLLPAGLAHRLVRARNVLVSQIFYQFARRRPEQVRAYLRKAALHALRDEAVVDEHFRPAYQPWDQRLCLSPDGDFYRSIRTGDAEVVTDRIETFTAGGIRLASGRELPADVVVSATGLEMLAFGEIELSVDGRRVDPGRSVAYRGVMLDGVPNFAFSIGYVNASWTLRSDLSARYVCRLLTHMDRLGYSSATPTATGKGTLRPLLDLTSGYVKRGAARFPKQGDRDPWLVRQNYPADLLSMTRADIRQDMTFVPRATVRRHPALQETTS
jgi:cation diffusion facilitator CzcD-associated flavoprotein CzcO